MKKLGVLVCSLLAGWMVGCGPSAPASTCTADPDCAAGTFCREGACVSDCESSTDCTGGATCDARGRCVAGVDGGPRDGGPSLTDSGSGGDAGQGDAGPVPCVDDGDCSDGTFCNGIESCAPGAGADARGCVPASAEACPADARCDEDADECLTGCDADDDLDDDGVRGTECGGTDCDDTDPLRYPGAMEICDVADPTHDEDCDPESYGALDADVDGSTSIVCCNTAADGSSICGPDCDDANSLRAPTLVEVCDGIDNDCGATGVDPSIDEGVLLTFYADADDDSYGDASGATMMACTMPDGYVPLAMATDCDDTRMDRNPGAGETRCDMLDDNCNGSSDEMLVGVSCTTTLPGACRAGTTACATGGGTRCVGTVAPMCSAGATMPCTTCSLAGTRTCDGCVYGACTPGTGAILSLTNMVNPPALHACGQDGGGGEWFSGIDDPAGCSFLTGVTQQIPAGTYSITMTGRKASDAMISISMPTGGAAGISAVSVTGTHGSTAGSWTSMITFRAAPASCPSTVPVTLVCGGAFRSCSVQSFTLTRTGS